MTVSPSSRIRLVGWVGLLINLALAAAKATAGIVGHSQAVLADALHSFTDSITDIAVILGVRYWTAPADEDHPHGHGRIETLITVVIGLAVGGVAIGMGTQAIRGLRHGPELAPSGIALAVALLSIVVKEVLYRWTAKVGREVRGPITYAYKPAPEGAKPRKGGEATFAILEDIDSFNPFLSSSVTASEVQDQIFPVVAVHLPHVG